MDAKKSWQPPPGAFRYADSPPADGKRQQTPSPLSKASAPKWRAGELPESTRAVAPRLVALSGPSYRNREQDHGRPEVAKGKGVQWSDRARAIIPPVIRHAIDKRLANTRAAKRELTVKQ